MTEVVSRPILFNGPMVRAILEGRKTQTRRIVKPQPPEVPEIVAGFFEPTEVDRDGMEVPGKPVFGFADEDNGWKCPYGKPGDRLWVRETWGVGSIYDQTKPSDICQDILSDPNWPVDKAPCGVRYPSNMECVGVKLRPSIHMPRWASRISLEIVGIRVERLNKISEEDAISEGCQCAGVPASLTNRGAFGKLWESINGQGSWEANPWVWVVEFKVLEKKQ